jgi:hypothetical protein
MTDVDICNQALAHLGDRRISRLDEDAQIADAYARYCAEYYEQAKQEVLAAHRWTFAKKAVALTREGGTPFIMGFNYSHVLPSDMLRLLTLVEGDIASGDTVPSSYTRKVDKFKIIQQKVWSNTEHLGLLYIGNINDPDEWTPHFRVCVSRLLASYLAGPVADNPGEVRNQLDMYERIALPNAQYYDAVQDNSNENSDADVRRAESPLLQRHQEDLSNDVFQT